MSKPSYKKLAQLAGGRRKTMKCHYREESLACAFHYNGLCLRDHNYECPGLAMKNLSHGEMVQIAEARKAKNCQTCQHEGEYSDRCAYCKSNKDDIGELTEWESKEEKLTPRYIDANKLIDLATHEGAYGYVDVHDIHNTPTADVVAVVRCKECKWYDGCGTCMKIGIAMLEPNWFCADGERKEKTDDNQNQT